MLSILIKIFIKLVYSLFEKEIEIFNNDNIIKIKIKINIT